MLVLVLGLAVVAGVVLAMLVIPDVAAWQHYHHFRYRG